MIRIFTRTTWVQPWHMAMLVGRGIAVEPLVRELRQHGLFVAIVDEHATWVRPPKI